MSLESSKLGLSLKQIPVLIYIRAWKLSTPDHLKGQVHFQGVLDGPNGKRLQIRVPDSTWRQEMHFQRTKLLRLYCDACQRLGLSREHLPVECHIVA